MVKIRKIEVKLSLIHILESFESDVAQNRVVKAQNDPVALKDIEENRASQLAKSSSEAIVSTMKGCVQMFSDVFDGLLH